MGIFRPRSPEALPQGAGIQFHFASDKPQASARASTVDSDAAIARVRKELADLRATVAVGGRRSAGAVQADIDRGQPEATALAKALDSARAQCVAGLIDISEVEQIVRERDAKVAKRRALRDELQKRNEADAAQAEIDRILQVIV